MHYKDQLISLLIRKGADISIKTKNGKTVLSVLKPHRVNYDDCVNVLIKEFAKLTFLSLPVPSADMEFIQSVPKTQRYFEQSVNELKQMSNTKFYGSHTHFSVLMMTKNMKKLRRLTQNEEFLEKFENSLPTFSCYGNDLRIVVEEAIQLRDELRAVVSRLIAVFKNFLPDIVIRKLAENLTLQDLPLELLS